MAPAGGAKQFSAAVENGADAVYIGGPRFNARMNAGNFTEESMKECIRYAHTRGAAVHVAMNTLISDGELPEALRQAERFWELGADALIVQDLGFASLLHRFFPEIELHLSTQGTVYNTAGVEQAAKLGFSRVVLARETSLAEMKQIASAVRAANCDVELEAFVHGALCMCYSGQCQLSRVIGGRSGNRGECAQPCRLSYQIYRSADGADGTGKADGADKADIADMAGGSSFSRRTLLGSGFLLSPKDLCGINHLRELSEAGIASLKIEGRMKSPEYVALVTGIYRRCLDEYAQTGKYSVSEEERLALAQIFSRGSFTTGYFFGNPRKELLSGELSKHRGIRVGTVESYDPRRQTVRVRLDAPLAIGDGVEIHSRRLAGNVITYKRESRGGQNESAYYEIGYIKEKVNPGDEIYKITDKTLMERARATYEGKSGSERKQRRKREVGMEFSARPGSAAQLAVHLFENPSDRCSDGKIGGKTERKVREPGLSVSVQSAEPVERAVNKPLDEEIVRRQLEKTGDTPFVLSKLKVDLGGEPVSLPLSVLNNMRRRALAELENKLIEEKTAGRRHIRMEAETEAALADLLYGAGRGSEPMGRTEMPVGCRVAYYLFSADREALELASRAYHNVPGAGRVPVNRFYLPYEIFFEEECREALAALSAAGKETIPVLPPITRGREDEFLADHMDRLKELALQYGICVGNLWQIEPFVKIGARVYGDFGLNFCNGSDVFLAGRLGLAGLTLSCEILPVKKASVISSGMLSGEVPGAENDPDFNYRAMLAAAKNAGLELELPAGGQVPLMISAHCPVGDAANCRGCDETGACDSGRYFLSDRKNQFYPLLTRKMDCQSLLFREEPLNNRKITGKFAKESGLNLRYYGIDKKIFCGRP